MPGGPSDYCWTVYPATGRRPENLTNRKVNVKLKHVYLSAAYPESLASFYEALGLTIRFADPGKWVQFAGEKTAFCIAGPTESVSDHSRDAVLVFEVDDLEEAIARARKAGASVSGKIRDMKSHGRVARVQDPLGNIIQFYSASS